ncbi:Myotubularin-like phosphatase domain [Balamuthia mandrillaris]
MSSVVTLRHQVVRGDDGKLRRSDLGLIWRAPAFPESIHHILIQLLRKFDILYPWSKLSSSMASSSSSNASKNASDSCLDSGNWKTGSPGKTDETETSKMDEDFLVPCLLKKERPFTVKKEWPHFEPEDVYDQIGRQWVFRFLPLGFFSRLFVRTLHVIQDWDIHKARLKRRSRNNSNASSNNSSSSSPSPRSTSAKSLNTMNSARWRLEAVRGQGAAELAAYWTNGVIVKVMKRGKNLEKGFLEYIPEEFLLKLHVRSQRGRTSKLFALLVENIESLLDGWYQNQVKEVLISCPHCIRLRVHPPNLFPLQEAEVAVAQGLPFLLCADEKVTIDQMAPDISLVHMEAFIIKPAEVKLLEEVGKGAYATVYRGILDGQEVAVKKINFSADTAALSSSTACSPSLASTPLPASSTIRNASVTASSPCPAASASTSTGHSAAAEGSLPSKLNNVTAMAELSEKFQELRREVLLMSTLNHPNTVGLKGICLSLPSFLILTEFLPYGNLYDFIHKATGALDWGLRLRIVRDVAEGMNFLHSTIPPTIHRDLKTPNVLMASTSSSAPTVAKVADFGLSTQMTEARMKGRNVWNPVWLAPEIMQNKEYTEKADVYSFGIIMWEVISLQHPFKEYTAEYDADSRLEDAIIQGLRPSVTFPEASESPEYMSLMQACWDDDPSARPDFATIIQRLEAIQRQLAPDTLSPYELASREAMAMTLSPRRKTKHLGSVMLGNRRAINSNNSNENETSPRKTMKDETGGAEQRNGMLSSASSSSSPRSSSPTKGKNKKKDSDDGSGSAADDYSGMKKPTLCSSKVPSTPVCMAVVRSDEGLSVWVGCEDGLVVRCNPKTGEVLDSTKAHKGPVVSIVQSGLPSRYVWTCSPDDSNVLCWDPKKFKSKKLKMGKKAGVSTLSYYHPSHIWAALLDDVCTLALIDVNEQKVALYLSAQKDGAAIVKRATAEKSSKKGQSSKNANSNNSVTCICSIGTNMWVASGSNIYIWSCEQKPEILDRMEGKAKDERFTDIQKVGQEVWSCTDKRNIYIWSLEGELLHSIVELPAIPNSLIWLPLSKLVWFAASNSLFVYDAKTYKEVERTIVDPKNDIAAFLLINKNTVWGVSKAGSIHVFSLNLNFRQDTSFRLLEAH